jgi:probable rRNA maturation factor
VEIEVTLQDHYWHPDLGQPNSPLETVKLAQVWFQTWIDTLFSEVIRPLLVGQAVQVGFSRICEWEFVEPELSELELSEFQVELLPTLLDNQSLDLSLRLTDDQEIQDLNQQYRQQNHPTDVLAFAALEVEIPQLSPQDDSPVYLGDIVISIDTAGRQAAQLGHSLEIEVAWLAAHGLLHLLGWDHPDRASLHRMIRLQVYLLEKIGLTPVLASEISIS